MRIALDVLIDHRPGNMAYRIIELVMIWSLGESDDALRAGRP